ncbi:xylose isomerase-like protein [Atractiella rhizophila]|nr:xylose isomerase-like protein [Atractiella rhizophila]
MDRLAIATFAVGRPEVGHPLSKRLQAISAAGFHGAEIRIEDLEQTAAIRAGRAATDRITSWKEDTKAFEQLKDAAIETYNQARGLGLEVVSLCPLMLFDGLKDGELRAKRLEEAKRWVELASLLHAKHLQIPASWLPYEQFDPSLTPADLAALADIARAHNPQVDIAFEFTAWSTEVYNVQRCVETVQTASRPNISVCLDTFHIGRDLLDPFSPTNLPPDHLSIAPSVLSSLSSSPSHLFSLFQISDALLLNPPFPHHSIYSGPDPSFPPFLQWSRKGRIFPYENPDGVCLLPIATMIKRVRAAGFEGWWSFETFEASSWETDDNTPTRISQRAMKSWRKLLDEAAK